MKKSRERKELETRASQGPSVNSALGAAGGGNSGCCCCCSQGETLLGLQPHLLETVKSRSQNKKPGGCCFIYVRGIWHLW